MHKSVQKDNGPSVNGTLYTSYCTKNKTFH